MQLNRLRVLPRDCNTDLTQIPMAAFSFVERLFRSLTVDRTFLMQWQNDVARGFILFRIYIFYALLVQSIMEINRLTHSRDDLCGIQSFYAQSVGPGRYMTTNLVPKATGVNPMAVDQLLIYPREGYGYNNASIDADSILRNQIAFKNNRCQIRPQSRPFLTVPYMAGGSPSRDVESLLLHSEQVRMGKECGTVTEEFFSQQYTPLIPVLKNNVQNPKNLVPEVAANGWIHGGIPTRSYLRDVNC